MYTHVTKQVDKTTPRSMCALIQFWPRIGTNVEQRLSTENKLTIGSCQFLRWSENYLMNKIICLVCVLVINDDFPAKVERSIRIPFWLGKVPSCWKVTLNKLSLDECSVHSSIEKRFFIHSVVPNCIVYCLHLPEAFIDL